MKCSIEFKKIFKKNKLGKGGKSSAAVNLAEGKKKKAGKGNTSEASEPAVMSPDAEKKKSKRRRKLEHLEKDTQNKTIKKRKQSTSTPSMDSTSVGRKRRRVMKNKSVESNYWSKLCKKKKVTTPPSCTCALAAFQNETNL